jgi:S1-C subfamily serine protease
VDPLVEKGRVIRPWIGIDGSLIGGELRKIFAVPLADGFLVEAVERGSPASSAGIVGGRLPVRVGNQSLILGGDIVVEINGIELKNYENLERALNTISIGEQVRMKVFRRDKTFTTEFVMVERPLQPGDVPESSQSFSVEGDGRRDRDNSRLQE